MVDFVAFGIVIDDILHPDGSTSLGLLGGGGPQAAFGMRLWSNSVGLYARAGPDLPPETLAWLDLAGIDRRGVQLNHLPTPRAWQVLAAGGERRQEWQSSPDVNASQLRRTIEDLPADYRAARGFHIGIHPNHFNLDFAAHLHRLGSLVSLETFKRAEPALKRAQAEAIFRSVEIISPNLAEAASLVGEGSPQEILLRMGRLGARVISLRLGMDGSLLSADGGRHCLHMPALPVNPAHPVGAGNAFCGGFLVGWCLHQDIRTAGLYATVAASFLLEQDGLPELSAGLQAEAALRLKSLTERL